MAALTALGDYAPQPDELRGRVVAITGATGGIGRALALAAAGQGAEVVLVARNVRKLTALHDELTRAHGDVATMAPLDFEKALAKDYDTLADALLQRYGRLDGLVHCAGQLGSLTPIEGYDVPQWCRVLHVNLTAAFALTQVLLPALRRSPSASVLFTSSSVGRRGRAYWGAYAVSKFALEGLTQVLAAELEGVTAVRVNAINPGRVRTAMRRAAYPSEDLATLPEPAAVIGPYLALLGTRFPQITGQSLDCQPVPATPSPPADPPAPAS